MLRQTGNGKGFIYECAKLVYKPQWKDVLHADILTERPARCRIAANGKASSYNDTLACAKD